MIIVYGEDAQRDVVPKLEQMTPSSTADRLLLEQCSRLATIPKLRDTIKSLRRTERSVFSVAWYVRHDPVCSTILPAPGNRAT